MPHDPKDTPKLFDAYLGKGFLGLIEDPRIKEIYDSLQAIANKVLVKKGEEELENIASHICDLVLVAAPHDRIEDSNRHYPGDRGYDVKVFGVREEGIEPAHIYIRSLQLLLD